MRQRSLARNGVERSVNHQEHRQAKRIRDNKNWLHDATSRYPAHGKQTMSAEKYLWHPLFGIKAAKLQTRMLNPEFAYAAKPVKKLAR